MVGSSVGLFGPWVQTTRPMSPPQPQPPHDPYPPPLRRFLTTISHAPGNPSRCDHISQSVLTTTSDHGVWYGRVEPPRGPNNPTYEPTATATTPPVDPNPTRPAQTRPRQGIRPGVTTRLSRCISNGSVSWYHTVDIQLLIHRPGTLTRLRPTIFVACRLINVCRESRARTSWSVWM